MVHFVYTWTTACHLNAVSKSDAYPMPTVDELIDQLRRANPGPDKGILAGSSSNIRLPSSPHCWSILDVLVVFSEIWKEHLALIEKVLQPSRQWSKKNANWNARMQGHHRHSVIVEL